MRRDGPTKIYYPGWYNIILVYKRHLIFSNRVLRIEQFQIENNFSSVYEYLSHGRLLWAPCQSIGVYYRGFCQHYRRGAVDFAPPRGDCRAVKPRSSAPRSAQASACHGVARQRENGRATHADAHASRRQKYRPPPNGWKRMETDRNGVNGGQRKPELPQAPIRAPVSKLPLTSTAHTRSVRAGRPRARRGRARLSPSRRGGSGTKSRVHPSIKAAS